MQPKQELGTLSVAVVAMMVACGGEKSRGGLRASRTSSQEDSQQECVFGPWSAPVNVGPAINGPFNDSHPWITKDGLSLYITTTRFSKNVNDEDIAVVHRRNRTAPWSTPVRLGPNVNTVGFNDSLPSISEDGLDLYFQSPRSGGFGAADIYVSHRDDPTDDFAWQPAVNLGPNVNSPSGDSGPDFFQADGTDYLYYTRFPPDLPAGSVGKQANIVLSTRPTGSGIEGWSKPVAVTELNSSFQQGRASIRRKDGLEMCISRTNDSQGFGGVDTYCSTRPSLSSPWSKPVNLGPTINTPFDDGGQAFDFSGQTLYLFSNRPGGFGMRDLYTVTRPRLCDEEDDGDQMKFGPWSQPTNLGPVVNSKFNDRHPAISPNGLSLYITSDRHPGGFGPEGTWNIWVSRRASLHDPWGPPRNLGPNINTPGGFAPNISPDGHWLFFAGGPVCGGGSPGNIWVSHREDTDDDFAWEPAVDLGPEINDPRCDSNAPTFFRDEETGITRIYLTGQLRRERPGNFHIYVSTQREDADDRGFVGTFGPAVLVPELSSPRRDTRTAIRRDGLEMFISSNRAGSVPDTSGQPSLDLWVSTRASTRDPWSTPANLGSTVNTPAADSGPALSCDGTTLYFYSTRGGFGGEDLYVTTRTKLGEDDAKAARGRRRCKKDDD